MTEPTALRIGQGKPGPGRPKGTRSKYVTINSLLEAIEERLGCTYPEALAELLADAKMDYDTRTDRESYPKYLMKLSDKLVEQARQIPENASSDLEELNDEELLAKREQAVREYIKMYGIPKMEAA